MPWDDGLKPETPAYIFASSDKEIMRALAGPGTGKTFALKRRIARLLEQGIDPQCILAITFTRTAASDLRREINSLNVDGADRVIAKTLHSFCFSILGKREILNSSGRVPRPLLDHETKPMLYDLSNSIFGNIREKEKRVKAFEAAWARLQHEEAGYAPAEDDQLFERELINWLREHDAMLLGEIIPLTLRYFRDNPLSPDLNQFDHVLVDEYQDLNKAEQELVQILKGNGNLVVIGDDDQSIYSFKHAHPEGIQQFSERNSDCESIEFAECRRCPKVVVNIASSLISNNRHRTLGHLLPFSGNDSGEVSILQWPTLGEEIEGIANIIAHHLDCEPIEPQDILVLTPRRRIGYRIRNLLNERDICAKSYFREEALNENSSKRIFSLLNLVANPDDKVALRFLLGHGNQDYRTSAYNRLRQRAESDGCNVGEVLDRLVSGDITIPHTTNITKKYTEILSEIDGILETIQSHPKDIIDFLLPSDNEELESLRSALEEAMQNIGEADNGGECNGQSWVTGLFNETRENISITHVPSNVDHVRIMSLHASKGLGAKFVIITSCIDEFLPGNIDSEEDQRRYEEEQRRLFYVAITRCKNDVGLYPGNLILSSCVNIPREEALRMGIPSRSGRMRSVRASRFMSQLGPGRPHTIAGTEYLSLTSHNY